MFPTRPASSSRLFLWRERVAELRAMLAIAGEDLVAEGYADLILGKESGTMPLGGPQA
jgi:hypothetical protein